MKNNWKESAGLKVTAAMLTILFLWLAACCGLAAAVCAAFGYYSADRISGEAFVETHSSQSEFQMFYESLRNSQLAASEEEKTLPLSEFARKNSYYTAWFAPETTNLRFKILSPEGECVFTNDSVPMEEQELIGKYSYPLHLVLSHARDQKTVHFTDLTAVESANMANYLENPSAFINWYFADDAIDNAYHNGVAVRHFVPSDQRYSEIFPDLETAKAFNYKEKYGENCTAEILPTQPAENMENAEYILIVTPYETEYYQTSLSEFLERQSQGERMEAYEIPTLNQISENGLDVIINADNIIAGDITVIAYIPKALPVDDIIRQDYKLYLALDFCSSWVLIGVFFFGALAICAGIVLCMCAGHEAGKQGITASRFHSIAYEFFYFLPVALLFFSFILVLMLRDFVSSWQAICVICTGLTLTIAASCVLWLYTTAIRAKCGTFWTSFGLIHLFIMGTHLLRGQIILSLFTAAYAVLLFCLNVFALPDTHHGVMQFAILLLDAVTVALMLYFIYAFFRLKTRAKHMAEGDYTPETPPIPLAADFRDFSLALDHMTDSISATVAQQTKSERMRTELITNVSHDLKTPLTSIVNYVGLLDREPMQTEQAKEYLEVLKRQSNRLKKLTEDLVEASKASTGNLAVELLPMDVSVLISQLAAEYEERFATRSLTLVTALPDSQTRILADGRHISRVFDNLLGNAYKYAMPNTRIYLDVEKSNGLVHICMKNISEHSLNISPDELTERFVRGDVSRHTEGSGLGLSIAKDLTMLQNGTLALQIDGDLFKALLTFPEYYEYTPVLPV